MKKNAEDARGACDVRGSALDLQAKVHIRCHYLKPVKNSEVRSRALAENMLRAFFVAKEVGSAVCPFTGCCWAAPVHTLALVMLGAMFCDLRVHLSMKFFLSIP